MRVTLAGVLAPSAAGVKDREGPRASAGEAVGVLSDSVVPSSRASCNFRTSISLSIAASMWARAMSVSEGNWPSATTSLAST